MLLYAVSNADITDMILVDFQYHVLLADTETDCGIWCLVSKLNAKMAIFTLLATFMDNLIIRCIADKHFSCNSFAN